MTETSKIIDVGSDGLVSLGEFSEFLDIGNIEFYSIKVKKDKSLVIKFYDKKGKVIKPHESK